MHASSFRDLRYFKKISQSLQSPINHVGLAQEIEKLTPILELPKINQNIYRLHSHENPVLMEEIGRLREICWRFYGWSMGKDLDIDFYDTNKASCYQQVFAWDTKKLEILGGCRYVSMVEMKEALGSLPQKPEIHTFEMLQPSKKFVHDFLPSTLELQRVFVIPRMGPNIVDLSIKHAPHVLDNIFKAIGQQVISPQKIAYVTGRATFPPLLFSPKTTNRLVHLLHHNISRYDLLIPRKKFRINIDSLNIPDEEDIESYVSPPAQSISMLKETYDISEIPVILKVYLNMGDIMYFFGGLSHYNSAEVAIMISMHDLFKKKQERYFQKDYIDWIAAQKSSQPPQ